MLAAEWWTSKVISKLKTEIYDNRQCLYRISSDNVRYRRHKIILYWTLIRRKKIISGSGQGRDMVKFSNILYPSAASRRYVQSSHTRHLLNPNNAGTTHSIIIYCSTKTHNTIKYNNIRHHITLFIYFFKYRQLMRTS